MKGFKFGVPYLYSIHYYLLCFYLAENGLNPMQDVIIKEVSLSFYFYYKVLKLIILNKDFSPQNAILIAKRPC